MAALNKNSRDEIRSAQPAWPGLAILAVVFAGLVIWSWRRWPNILIDFGPQFYIPWRITEGAVLYRDVAYLPGGPLSHYWNALLFKIFGVSFLTLVIANLTITAGLVTLIYRRFLAASDAFTATTIGFVILVVFAFAQYPMGGNYTYAVPYSHEVFHGLVLSVVAVTCLADWLGRKKLHSIMISGFCFGLVFMTKPDIFVALALTALAALVWSIAVQRIKFPVKHIGAFVLTAIVAPLGFLLYFYHFETWRESARSVAYAFVPLLESHVTKEPYYQKCLGLDDPWMHLRVTLLQSFCLVGAVLLAAFLFRLKTDSVRNRSILMFFTGALAAGSSAFAWIDSGSVLPFVSVLLVVALVWIYRKSPVDSPRMFPLLWSVFGVAMLIKMGFASRITHYGFVLGMPAYVSGIFLLLWIMPGLLEKFGVQRRHFRNAFWLALIIGVVRLTMLSGYYYGKKNTLIWHGADQILVNDDDSPVLPFKGAPPIAPVDISLGHACEWIDQNIPASATLAALPEGAVINYLTRRVNPSRYIVWIPPEIAAFGQAAMTEEFRRQSPDYVVIVHRRTPEYQASDFGKNPAYGQDVMAWIHQNYVSVHLIGHEPFTSGLFGVQILKRRST